MSEHNGASVLSAIYRQQREIFDICKLQIIPHDIGAVPYHISCSFSSMNFAGSGWKRCYLSDVTVTIISLVLYENRQWAMQYTAIRCLIL